MVQLRLVNKWQTWWAMLTRRISVISCFHRASASNACGAWFCFSLTCGFGVIFEVAEYISGQAVTGNFGSATSTTESGLVAPNSTLTDIWACISAIKSISGRETTSSRDSGSGLSIGGTSDFPYVRATVAYHWADRFCATDVGRTRRYTGAGTEPDSLTGWLAYVTLYVEIHFYCRSLTKMTT